jgi:hypothetical protein
MALLSGVIFSSPLLQPTARERILNIIADLIAYCFVGLLMRQSAEISRFASVSYVAERKRT